MAAFPKTAAGCKRLYETRSAREWCKAQFKKKVKRTKVTLGATHSEHSDEAHYQFVKAREAADTAHKHALRHNCAGALKAGAKALQLVGQARAEDLNGSGRKSFAIRALGRVVVKSMGVACSVKGASLSGTSKRRRRR